ncbi:extracellular solute-binding protein [Tomitella biformata]|uniref:extracellular solute-binding protein n=1 Tax=Tomitella biformata TaxID=630403 RepID=UPI00046726BA|nr:extracellular solute-binding protein [Tomitella biformata]
MPYRTRIRGSARILLPLALTAALLASCAGGSSDEIGGGGGGADDSGNQLTLVAAATPELGFQAVIKAYQQTEQGKDQRFGATYGPSGDQSRKVVSGLKADLASFSVEPDMTRLVDADLVDPSWDQGADRGVPFGSVVVLAVRKGNPLGITGWDDLLKPGVEVITPDPRSSGSAMWNMLAPYAAKSDGGADKEAGLSFVQDLVQGHVTARPSSGRAATDLFLQGSGDVLISYENEAIFMERGGADVEHVVPDDTMRIDNPFAVLSQSPHPEDARAFTTFLYSAEAQRIWAEQGFRPVDPAVAQEFAAELPAPARLRTVDDLGGWAMIYPELFDKNTGEITKIYAEATR